MAVAARILSNLPLRRVAGRFYRAMLADRTDAALDRSGSTSAGRYHRPGQPALYVTPEADWAAIAVGGYQAEDGLARVVVPLDVSAAWVVEQHDEAVCAALGIDRDASNVGWRKMLAAGDDPPSWHSANVARASGADGIIDRSRGIVGGWHVALFRWNMPGGPKVRVAGQAVPADYFAARSRWASPSDWVMPVLNDRID